MNKENIRLIKYLGVILLAVVLIYKIPHDSYSLIQYIIKPIMFKTGGILTLSGIVPLILFVVGIKGICKLERFADKSRIIIVLIIFVVMVPFINWTMDFARINYHSLRDDGINSIDIEDSDIHISGSNGDTIININLELKNYSRRHFNEFKIRVYLPKSVSKHIGKEYYELENTYMIHDNNHILNVHEQIFVDRNNSGEFDELFHTNWFWEDVKYELYDDNKKVIIIKHGF